ncbi:hypothetical protein HanRHA438_Chr16g0751691 [Helianthus annuus]|nr:hypothetical protein HanRHA438_Chr16g0751691 [Helianthus annuus]
MSQMTLVSCLLFRKFSSVSCIVVKSHRLLRLSLFSRQGEAIALSVEAIAL